MRVYHKKSNSSGDKIILQELIQPFVRPPCASSTSSHVTLMMVKSCCLVFFYFKGEILYYGQDMVDRLGMLFKISLSVCSNNMG